MAKTELNEDDDSKEAHRRYSDTKKCQQVPDSLNMKQENKTQFMIGREYECFIAMFFILKATICGKNNFKVGIEIGQAQKFDDLLFFYEKESEKFCRCLQAKHTRGKKKINAINLLTIEQSDFSIIKYFFSFKDLIYDEYFKGIIHEDLIIYTNFLLDFSSNVGKKMITNEFKTLKSNDIKKVNDLFKIIDDNDDILDVDEESLRRFKLDNEPNVEYVRPLRCKLNENSDDILKSIANEYNITRLSRALIDWLMGMKKLKEVEHIIKPYWKFLKENFIKKGEDNKNEIILTRNETVEKQLKIFIGKLNKEIVRKNKYETEKKKNKKQEPDKEYDLSIPRLNEMMSKIKDFPNWNVDTIECDFSDVIKIKEIQHFSKLLVFAVRQPNVDELKFLINDMILKHQERKYGGDMFYSTDDIHRYKKEIFEYCHDKVFKWTEVEMDRMKRNKGRKETYMTDKDGKAFLENNWKEIKFNVKQPVKLFLERDKEMAILHKGIQRGTTVNSHVHVICGDSGIGKTEFVRKYIEKYSCRFENRILWIDGKSCDSVEYSFRKLSEELKIPTVNLNDKREEMSIIVSDVYKEFQGKKCLFVFDGATNQKQIDPYMPRQTNDGNIPFVIITSTKSEWLGVKKIKLERIEERGTKLVETKTCIEESIEVKNIEHLVFFLKNILSAVQITSAYMKKKIQNDPRFQITECLNTFTANQKQIQGLNLPPSITTDIQVTMIVYKSIIDSIIKSQDIGLKAVEILSIISFMAPDNINIKWFTEQTAEDKGKIFQLLEDYSIVDLNSGKINIDNSIQTMTRFELKEQNKEEMYVDKALKLFTDVYQKDGITYDIFTIREITPHLEAYTSYLDTVCESWSKIQRFNYIEESLWMLQDSYREMKDLKKMVKTIDRLQPIASEKYGEESIATAVIGIDLGTIASNEGNWNESKKYYEKALEICLKKCGDKNVLLVDIQMKLGDVEINLGNIEKSQLHFANAFRVCEDYCDSKNDLKFVEIEVKLGETKAKMGNLDESKTHFKKALDIYLQNFDEDVKTADIEMKLGDVKLNLGDFEESKSHYKKALKVYQKPYDKESIDIANIELKLGDVESKLCNFEDSKLHYDKALAILNKNPTGKTKLRTADVEVKLGDIKSNLNNYCESKLHFKKALSVYLENCGEHDLNTANTQIKLGDVEIKLENYDESKLHYQQALSVYIKNHSEQQLNIANIHIKMGDVETNLKQYIKSKNYFDKALNVYSKKLGNNNINTANIEIKLGDVETNLESYNESKLHYRKALKVYMDHYGERHLNTVNTQVKLGVAEIHLKNYPESKHHLEKALHVFKTNYSDEKLSIAQIQFKLGDVETYLQNYNQSKEYYIKALAEYTNYYDDTTEEAISVCINLGNTEYYLGDFEKSKTYYEKALDIRLTNYGEHDVKTADTYLNLGVVEFSLNNIEESISCYKKALMVYMKTYGKDHEKTTIIYDNLAKILNRHSFTRRN